MRNYVLMEFEEPTDAELSELMHEVAQEAKRKAMIVQKQLAETVRREIQIAHSKMQEKTM